MSDDSIVNKYLRQQQPSSPVARGPVETSEAYVPMLDLVLGNGNRVALPYAMLMKVAFDPSRGITLQFASDNVTVTGFRLEAVYRGLVQHRVRELVASPARPEFIAHGHEREAGTEPVISGIRCEPAG